MYIAVQLLYISPYIFFGIRELYTLLKICIENPSIHPTLFAFEEVSALPVGTRSAEHCLTVLDGRKRREKYRMIQFTGFFSKSREIISDQINAMPNWIAFGNFQHALNIARHWNGHDEAPAISTLLFRSIQDTQVKTLIFSNTSTISYTLLGSQVPSTCPEHGFLLKIYTLKCAIGQKTGKVHSASCAYQTTYKYKS